MIPQDKIIKWAREAGLTCYGASQSSSGNHSWHAYTPHLVEFAKLVAQHQKEQNARICDEIEKHLGIASECAAAIRSQE